MSGAGSEARDRVRADAVKAALDRYWRSNLRIMAGLLVVWAFVSLGCGVLWADWLNEFKLPGLGFPLGFWFAQQGSIATFVLCILVYCLAMNRLDRRHHDELEALGVSTAPLGPDQKPASGDGTGSAH
jgi:putative solute:sodium symporter small subunit